MKKLFLSLFVTASLSITLPAEEHNSSKKTTDLNITNSTMSKEKERIEKKVQEQMKREEKYAKEQAFYQGSDYNLSERQVDPKSLSSIPVIEPDYDFDMDDVYSD